jgi:hypothetical protein
MAVIVARHKGISFINEVEFLEVKKAPSPEAQFFQDEPKST